MNLNRIHARLGDAINTKVFPGCVVGIMQRDGEQAVIAMGRFTYEETSPSVHENTQYDVASITKSIPTGVLALKLIEKGIFRLEDRLTKYLSEFQNNYSDQVLIKHLLTYSVIPDFQTQEFSVEKTTPEELQKNLLTTNLKFPPGEKMQYMNAPAILLTMLIERTTGSTIDVLATEYFFGPLGMKDSTFAPEFPKEIPPTEVNTWRGLVQGVVHDETSFVLGRERLSGCAGLFSSAPDLLTFLGMLLSEGTYRGRRYFTPETIRGMHTAQLSTPDFSMGLGWELNNPRFMGKGSLPSTFGKTGFTGTSCVVDPVHGVAIVLLSNRTYPKRGDRAPIDKVRRDIFDIVFKDITT